MRKSLQVTIASGTVENKEIPEDWCRDFVGGERSGVRLLSEYMDTECDPLDPESPIIFSTAPLNGTTAPSCGRMLCIFQSQATPVIGMSNIGMKIGP